MEDSKKKWILFAALAVIVIGLVAVLIVTVFKPAGPAAPSENSVSAVIPDGEASRMEDSKSKVYRGSTESYFAELDAADAAREDISLLSSDGTAPALTTAPITGSAAPEDAVSRVFSPAPSAPAPAATSAPARRSSGGGGATSRPMTEDERLDYDRRRAEMGLSAGRMRLLQMLPERLLKTVRNPSTFPLWALQMASFQHWTMTRRMQPSAMVYGRSNVCSSGTRSSHPVSA